MMRRHFIYFLFASCIVRAQAAEGSHSVDNSQTRKVLRLVADVVVHDATFRFVDRKSEVTYASLQAVPSGINVQPKSPYTDWRYWNGVLNIAMIRLGEVLGDSTYSTFSQKNVAFGFDSYQYFEGKYKKESKWEYPFAQLFTMEELDDYGAMGASVIDVLHRDPQPRYRAYINKAGHQILNVQHRFHDSTFIREFPKEWTLWADDLYMSVSFLSRMGELAADRRYFDDAARQVINFQKHLFDTEKGIMHHNWYTETNREGVAFWGRANGWAILAQVDLLDRLPQDHPQRVTLLGLLRRHIDGILKYQSSTGLWHQLLDRDDSYLETSCSAMFTYAIARSVNKGYVEGHFASVARLGWEGVLSKIRADGQIEGVCTGTVVSDDLSDYYSRPTPLNDIHGVGAVLLAGSEILRLPK